MKPTSYYVDNWLMELHCSNCNNRYQVCTLCSSNRKQFFSFNDVKKHANQNSHRKKELCTKIPQSKEVQTDHPECNQIFEANATEEITPEPDVMNVLGAENLKYFLMESISKGNAHLYASSFSLNIISIYPC